MQSGFVPGDSTTNQLAYLYNTFCKAVDSGLEVRAIFCDISKAFDRVWHKGLISKLKAAGITGDLLNWISSYLHNRKQRVCLPGSLSAWKHIEAGVPQGSILGPLLFLILYINDIINDISSNIRLFADDTSLYIIVRDPARAAETLNTDIRSITSWADKWLVKFNPKKTESLLISRKSTRLNHPSVYMRDCLIPEVDFHKHLGLNLSGDLTWHKHIDHIKSQAWQRINVMRKLKFELDRASLETIYTSFIRPILEYGDVIFDNCNNSEALDLEKIQYEAARIVTGATKLVSIEKLLREVGWEKLEIRRKKHKLTLFYKMVNHLTPPFLNNLVPNTVGTASRYGLRNANDLQTVDSRTTLYYNSFLPSVVRDWNSLPITTRQSPTLSVFKNSLVNPTSVPKHFYYGERKSQVLLTRLRTNCSALNHDLYTNKYV